MIAEDAQPGAGLVRLSSTGLETWVSPAHGGALACLFERASGLQLLREMTPADMEDGGAMKFGCFPMAPYSNRMAFRRLSYGGRAIELAGNREAAAHAFHGNAWMHAWQVDSRSQSSLTLSFANAEGDPHWPYAYALRQNFSLEGNCLRIAMTLTNTGDSPFPAGLGWHPFFRIHPDSRLRFSARQVWLNDKDMLPERQAAVDDAWSVESGRLLQDLAVDNCFAGWDGAARLEHPSTGRALMIRGGASCSHLVVFHPTDGRQFVAIEPVTHVNNGANLLAAGRQDTGIVILQPGASTEAWMSITIETL